MKRTRDELFLLKLDELLLQTEDPSPEVDRYLVGKELGQNEHAVDNIVRHLAQANFIKKGEGNAIYLTENGQNLVEVLKEDV